MQMHCIGMMRLVSNQRVSAFLGNQAKLGFSNARALLASASSHPISHPQMNALPIHNCSALLNHELGRVLIKLVGEIQAQMCRLMSAFAVAIGDKADMAYCSANVRL
jgi:hypothetical protein